MSTKIYTGFRFQDDMTLMQIHEAIMKFQKMADDIVFDEVANWITRTSVWYFDSLTMGWLEGESKETSMRSCVLSAASQMLNKMKREMDKSMVRDPWIDFTMEISILPLGRKKILGMYFAENQRLINAWMSQPFVNEYHYQNQTDRPNDISVSEWRKRRRDWDKIFKDSSVPAMCGFRAQLTPKYYPIIQVDEVLKRVKTLAERAFSVAREMLYREKEDEGEPTIAKITTWFQWMNKTPEGQAALKAKIKEVKKKLKKRICKNDLLERFRFVAQ